jgi:hypothetical protein
MRETLAVRGRRLNAVGQGFQRAIRQKRQAGKPDLQEATPRCQAGKPDAQRTKIPAVGLVRYFGVVDTQLEGRVRAIHFASELC